MDDLTLPVSRCPGIAAVAREVLGLDPWRKPGDLGPWWAPVPGGSVWDSDACVPLALPAGRLVAETWLCGLGASPSSRCWEHTGVGDLGPACLYLGDLLRVCAALGVDVPKGTVPAFTRDSDAGWGLFVPGAYHLFDTEDDDEDLGVTHVVESLAVGMSAREALDAICKEVPGV